MKQDVIAAVTFVLLALPCVARANAESNRVDYFQDSFRYSNLWDHADLVIIGGAISSRGTGATQDFKDQHHSVTCEQVNTSFDVELVLKGTSQTDRVTLLHYRLSEGSKSHCWTCPILATFEVDSGFLRLGPARPEYLLFLKATPSGCYVPVSGQVHSEFSIREVYGLLNREKPDKSRPENSSTFSLREVYGLPNELKQDKTQEN